MRYLLGVASLNVVERTPAFTVYGCAHTGSVMSKWTLLSEIGFVSTTVPFGAMSSTDVAFETCISQSTAGVFKSCTQVIDAVS